MSVKTVSEGFLANWVLGTTPGSGSGFAFEKDYKAPKCPHAVSNWKYFSQSTGNIEDDSSLTVTCGSSKDTINQN